MDINDKNLIDIVRLKDVFEPSLYEQRTIGIIGCGAIGSKVAMELACLGLNNITLYDFDIVESHNLSNQAFMKKHIGMNKAEALAQLICEKTEYLPTVKGIYDGTFHHYIFCMVDSMKTRREIFDRNRMNPNLRLIIECRMGVNDGYVYVVPPSDIQTWYETWFENDVRELSACGSPISVGMTSSFQAGLTVWAFIKLNSVVQLKEISFDISKWGITIRELK